MLFNLNNKKTSTADRRFRICEKVAKKFASVKANSDFERLKAS